MTSSLILFLLLHTIQTLVPSCYQEQYPLLRIKWRSQSSRIEGITGKQVSQSVQLLSCVQLFETPWTSLRQASLSIINSWSLPKLMSIDAVMPSNHLILCRPLLLLPSIFPNIRVFSNESALPIRWPNIGVSASTSVFPMNTLQKGERSVSKPLSLWYFVMQL